MYGGTAEELKGDLSFKLKALSRRKKCQKKQLLVSLESTLVGSVSGVAASTALARHAVQVSTIYVDQYQLRFSTRNYLSI